MKTKYSRLTLACVALFGFAMMGDDCRGDIVNDPAFRDWCGANLCAWQTDYGQIQRVPTWIAEDFGVSFLDNADGRPPGTEISQVTQENGATCILFTSVGNIDPQANMVVKADFDNDGTIDYTAPLGAANWTQVQTEITAPAGYNGITFYVAKEGTGTAVLAEMRIQFDDRVHRAPSGVEPALQPRRLVRGDLGVQAGARMRARGRCGDGLLLAVLRGEPLHRRRRLRAAKRLSPVPVRPRRWARRFHGSLHRRQRLPERRLPERDPDAAPRGRRDVRPEHDCPERPGELLVVQRDWWNLPVN